MSAARALDAAYLAHNVPARLPAGTSFGAWLRLANTGAQSWTRGDPPQARVELAVFWDDVIGDTHALPCQTVAAGDALELHFALRVPAVAGSHTLTLDLVQQGVTLFSQAGSAPLRLALEAQPSTLDASEKLLARARRSSPWHDQPTSGLHRARDGGRFPLFATRALGCRSWAAEGRAHVDYVMGWGSALLGYAHRPTTTRPSSGPWRLSSGRSRSWPGHVTTSPRTRPSRCPCCPADASAPLQALTGATDRLAW